jgi:acyl-CoA synthetase (AMP-forming)/AMP-acid ligase II
VTDEGRKARAGEEGELLVRGPTVMLGYWGLAEKTREVLIDNPFQGAYREPVYRTGDIVRLEADGNYTFIGRRDHMVKARGHRIELGEIEIALNQNERLREVAVLAKPDEEVGARIVAVVAPHAGQAVTAAELSAFCLARLPKYMVPEHFLIRSELPKTSTGKIDRVSLANTCLSTVSEEARS